MERTGYETGQLDDEDVMDVRDADTDTDADLEAQRAEIDRTRCEMAGTLDAIKDKLEPGKLMDQAKERVTEAADTVMTHAKETVHEVTSDVVGQAKDIPRATMDAAKRAVGGAVESARETMRPAVERVGEVGGTVVDTVKSNPIPYALIGIGLGWLYFSSRRSSGGSYEGSGGYRGSYEYGYTENMGSQNMGTQNMGGQGSTGGMRDTMSGAADTLRDKAETAVNRVQEKAGQVADRVQDMASTASYQVREKAGMAADTFQSQLERNPMSVGLIAVGLGLCIGMMLPETQKERSMLGDARSKVGEKVQQVASDLGQKVQAVARDTVDAAKQSAEDQGLTGAGTGTGTSSTTGFNSTI